MRRQRRRDERHHGGNEVGLAASEAYAGSGPLFPGAQYATGNGMFAAPVHYPAGDYPIFVAIGDLDGDQVPDLAVANFNSDNVSVLLGVGEGTFAAAAHYAAGSGPESVAIGDLDGDQVPDLAVANADSDNVSVLLGLGDGTFAAAVHYPVGTHPTSVAIGDLDGDQKPDQCRPYRIGQEAEGFEDPHGGENGNCGNNDVDGHDPRGRGNLALVGWGGLIG